MTDMFNPGDITDIGTPPNGVEQPEPHDGNFSDDDVAHVVHEANRVLQGILKTPGVPQSPPWDYAPEDQRRSAINGVRYTRENPDITPRDSHESWSQEKIDNGWVVGPVKDPEAKTHPNLVDYDELPIGERKKDDLFAAIVKALS